MKSVDSPKVYLYSAIRIAFVLVLCVFSAADDLTDVIRGGLRHPAVAGGQARSANAADDDRDDNQHEPVAALAGVAGSGLYRPMAFHGFVCAARTPDAAARPRPVEDGRAPPGACSGN